MSQRTPKPKRCTRWCGAWCRRCSTRIAAFLTTGGMPPRTREILGCLGRSAEGTLYQQFAAVCRSRPVNWLWSRLPMKLRYNGYARKGFANA